MGARREGSTLSATLDAPAVPSVGDLADTLTSIADHLAAMDALAFRLVDAVGEALRSSAAETIEGLPIELWLESVCRLPGGEAWFYRQAADVLRQLPATHGLWAKGDLSWGQVRRIVRRARTMSHRLRRDLDERIAASAERFGKMDPDDIIRAVELVADELEGAAKAERAEERQIESEFLHIQPDFLGGVKLYGELGPLSGAIVTNALDHRIGRRTHDPTDPGDAPSRAKQNAAALVSICGDELAGHTSDGTKRPAKPLLLVGVQLSDCTTTAAGTVELDVPGILPTVTARTVEALNQDADLRAVLFDGATPLAVSKKLQASDIPADTRLAVWLRDRTCRFPGSDRPATSAHVHHLVHRADGGDHRPDNLALIADTFHTNVLHRYGWTITLDPDDGSITATRGERTITRLPRWVGLAQPDDRGPPSAN